MPEQSLPNIGNLQQLRQEKLRVKARLAAREESLQTVVNKIPNNLLLSGLSIAFSWFAPRYMAKAYRMFRKNQSPEELNHSQLMDLVVQAGLTLGSMLARQFFGSRKASPEQEKEDNQ